MGQLQVKHNILLSFIDIKSNRRTYKFIFLIYIIETEQYLSLSYFHKEARIHKKK